MFFNGYTLSNIYLGEIFQDFHSKFWRVWGNHKMHKVLVAKHNDGTTNFKAPCKC